MENFKVLLPPGQIMLATAPTVSQLRSKLRDLRDYSDEDFLLAMGDPIAIGLAVAIAANNNGGRVKMLKWDRRELRYYAIEANIKRSRSCLKK
jgi:hypothetical protein